MFTHFSSEILPSLEATCADFDAAALWKCCPLQVHKNAPFTGWIILGCAHAVGVPSRHATPTSAEWTNFHRC